MFAVLAVIEVSGGLSARLITKDISIVTGRSLLSDYNLALFNRYGIFALQSNDEKLMQKAQYYIDIDCGVKKGLIRLSATSIIIDTSNYPALSVNDLQTQIEKIAVSDFIAEKIKEFADTQKEQTVKEKNANSNASILKDILPSKLLGYNSREILIFSGGILDSLISSSLCDEYILSVCSNHLNYSLNTYLKNEIEYILFGFKSDKENYESMKRSLLALRIAVNTAKESIETPDPVLIASKSAEILNRSEADVQSIINGGTADNIDYKGYLRILLQLLENDEKTARLMDIIQLNLQYIDGSGFAFSDYSYGFDMSAEYEKDVIAPNILGIKRKYRTEEMSFIYK